MVRVYQCGLVKRLLQVMSEYKTFAIDKANDGLFSFGQEVERGITIANNPNVLVDFGTSTLQSAIRIALGKEAVPQITERTTFVYTPINSAMNFRYVPAHHTKIYDKSFFGLDLARSSSDVAVTMPTGCTMGPDELNKTIEALTKYRANCTSAFNDWIKNLFINFEVGSFAELNAKGMKLSPIKSCGRISVVLFDEGYCLAWLIMSEREAMQVPVISSFYADERITAKVLSTRSSLGVPRRLLGNPDWREFGNDRFKL